MLMGSITNLLDSTSAVQQSINFFFLCSLFHCRQVVIPNVYRSLQALDSLLLPSSLSGNNCQKKQMTLAKNPLNCPLDLYYIHSSYFPSCNRQTTVNAYLPKVYPPPQSELGFPGGSAGKESACNAGDLGLIPGLGRSPGEENSYPVFWPWRIPRTIQSMRLQRVGLD